MKNLYAVEDRRLLDELNPELGEIVIACRELSRYSNLSLEDAIGLIEEAKARGFEVYFDFDILTTESSFDFVIRDFLTLPFELISAIRVQDLGLAEYIFRNSECDIHLITETGNHNLVGLKTYEKYFGSRLKRLVLSSELNWEVLKSYSQSLKSELEILGFGRLLIFYTPRKLVSHYDRFEWINEQIEVCASSEESPHKGFPVLENRHGTFMYHIKELFLFDRLNLIEDSGVDSVRIDLRHRGHAGQKEFLDLVNDGGLARADLKEQTAKKSIRGYFITNKSDVLFKKLKNSRIQRKDQNYLGEVIDSAKDNYMAIEVRGDSSINVGDEVSIFNPDGKVKQIKIESLEDISGNKLESKAEGLVLTKYQSGIWVKAQIYHKNAQDNPAH